MKQIEISDRQYELLEQEREHLNTDMGVVELLSEFMAGYAYLYGPDPSFTQSEARGAKDE